MRRVRWFGISGTFALMAAMSGCSASTGAPSASPGTTDAVPATDEVVPTRPAFILEDMGIDVELAPGTYVSRVFQRPITLELGPGWFRRDPIHARGFNLRAGPDGDRDVTFTSGIDFMQCGSGPVVVKPDAATIIKAITSAPRLTIASRRDVPVASGMGTELRLVAEPGLELPEALEEWPELGCMMANGTAPFPADGAWIGVTADLTMQLIVADDRGTAFIVRGRPSSIVDEHYDAILELVAKMSLG